MTNAIKIYDVITGTQWDEAEAIEWLTEVYYEADITSQTRPTHSRLIDTVEDGTLDIYYDYGADYYFCAVNEGDL
jgi:hypothetical protein